MIMTGCMSSGTKFDFRKAEQLVPSTSTLTDATKLLGKPNGQMTLASGEQIVTWVYIESSPLGAKSKTLSILFGPDNKMIRVASRSEIDTR
jgi:hypothetical protein